MTLYQRILKAIKERPLTMQELTHLLQAKQGSVQSALRDLRRHGFISGVKQGWITTYSPTGKAEGFTHVPQRPGRPSRRKQPTTVQIAVLTVPNSVFALGAMHG